MVFGFSLSMRLITPCARPARRHLLAAPKGPGPRGLTSRHLVCAPAGPTSRRTLFVAMRAISFLALLLAASALPGVSHADDAPACKGYQIEQPADGIVRPGTPIVFYSFWDDSSYTVTADLSGLCSSAPRTLAGTLVGMREVNEGDEQAWPCFRFSWTMPETTDVPDGPNITVPVTASAPETTVTDAALLLCLSMYPPVHDSTWFVEDLSSGLRYREGSCYVRNGADIVCYSRWVFHDTPPVLRADFSDIDSDFNTAGVFIWLAEPDTDTTRTFSVHYRLSEEANEDGIAGALRLWACGPGCICDTVTVPVIFDNQGPEGAAALFDEEIPEEVTADTLVVKGSVPDGSQSALVVVNSSREYVADVWTFQDSLFCFQTTVHLEAGVNTVVAYGLDDLGNRSEASAMLSVSYLSAPVFGMLELVVPDSTGDTTNVVRGYAADSIEVTVWGGATLIAYSYWDGPGYNLQADFSLVDSLFGSHGNVLVSRAPTMDQVIGGEGDSPDTLFCYRIEYTLSDALFPDDSDIPVPITAFDPARGTSTTTRSWRVCISDDPPIHLWTRILGDASRWRIVQSDSGGVDSLYAVTNGDSIHLETCWFSRNEHLAVWCDFGDLDQFASVNDAWVWKISLPPDTDPAIHLYGIKYKVRNAGIEESERYVPVTIEVFDEGCGRSIHTVFFEADIDGPNGETRLDPLPASVSDSHLALTGQAPWGSEGVVIVLNDTTEVASDSLSPAADSSCVLFWAGVDLLPGQNRLKACATDELGNKGECSPVWEVYLATGLRLEIPKPFFPGDAILIEDTAGWTEAHLQIFNLEGRLLKQASWSGTPPGHYWTFVWEGRNSQNELIRQGPLLLRLETRGSGGKRHEETKAFVLSR